MTVGEQAVDAGQWRDLFPITGRYVFMNHAGVAPLSRPAAEAMREYVQQATDLAGLGAGFYRRAEQVRRAAAGLINADAGELTFVKNTTEGIGWVANGLKWRSGDNVVTTGVEFPANVYPWMALKSRGVELRMVPEDEGRIPTERIMEAIDGRTHVLTVSAVQYGSGFRMDLETLGRFCRERGVLFCVDAIQALGVLPIDVRAMNIDFLSADGHKWLCGPEGCGIFYCRRELLGEIEPVMAGWLCMKDALDFGNYRFEFVDTACKFDTGSYNLAGVYGLGASIEMFLEIGVERIRDQVLMLTDRLVEGLKGKGYRIILSRRPGEASGIVAFASGRHRHDELRDRLEREHHVVIAVREGRLRASPHFYNTIEEMDRLVELLPSH
ncbi:MAG TPA: aminotransferase class V-fold PLP-dependent enzyme [Phycisphaerae bacterium]|nr:aminotransferase class V-fold PLP-dependent enzyme [Phycisphaerae bacterium]